MLVERWLEDRATQLEEMAQREAQRARDEKVSVLNNPFFTTLPEARFTYRYIIKDALQLQVTEF